ncbi:MAG: hypothetical protein M0010_09610 [Actinomycetota bacterium]|jgi:hypothetical protein|nr:hypothetical protein [Actinomycetota bacterium]
MTELLTPVLVRMLEGRVGSTLLMQLLGTSPLIAFDRVYPYENSYLSYLVRLCGLLDPGKTITSTMSDVVYGAPGHLCALPFPPQLADGESLARGALGGVWRAVTHLAQRHEPTPRYYAEKFWGSVMPVVEAGLRPIVIDLVRDPRDLIASVRAFNTKTGVARFGRSQVQDDDAHLRRLVAGIRMRIAEMDQDLQVPRMTLRYEDLVQDVVGVALRVSELLEVAVDPARLPDFSDMTHHTTSPTAAASIGRWRTELSATEVETIERRLGPAMSRFGYALH